MSMFTNETSCLCETDIPHKKFNDTLQLVTGLIERTLDISAYYILKLIYFAIILITWNWIKVEWVTLTYIVHF